MKPIMGEAAGETVLAPTDVLPILCGYARQGRYTGRMMRLVVASPCMDHSGGKDDGDCSCADSLGPDTSGRSAGADTGLRAGDAHRHRLRLCARDPGARPARYDEHQSLRRAGGSVGHASVDGAADAAGGAMGG